MINITNRIRGFIDPPIKQVEQPIPEVKKEEDKKPKGLIGNMFWEMRQNSNYKAYMPDFLYMD
jgi:hypothetical protein